jgi:hypothetical protein
MFQENSIFTGNEDFSRKRKGNPEMKGRIQKRSTPYAPGEETKAARHLNKSLRNVEANLLHIEQIHPNIKFVLLAKKENENGCCVISKSMDQFQHSVEFSNFEKSLGFWTTPKSVLYLKERYSDNLPECTAENAFELLCSTNTTRSFRLLLTRWNRLIRLIVTGLGKKSLYASKTDIMPLLKALYSASNTTVSVSTMFDALKNFNENLRDVSKENYIGSILVTKVSYKVLTCLLALSDNHLCHQQILQVVY